MNVVSSTGASTAPPKSRPAAHKAFDRAWKKVIAQQQKNAALRAEMQAFSREVSAAIEAHEKAHLEAVCRTCEHLLQFGTRKSMSLGQRAALLRWIMDYVSNIARNPFADAARLHALNEAVHAQMRALLSRGAGAGRAQDPHLRHPDDEFDAPGDEDDADDEAPDSDAGYEAEPDDFAGTRSDEFDDEPEPRDARKAEGAALNDLMRGSSINRVFRKVARSLHPDREPDEGARVEKNRLMGLLLQARANNDIPTMFALYAEHVGESPLRELADDLQGVTRLLVRQYEHLRSEELEIVEETSLTAALYRRFHRASRPAMQREISKHLRELQFDTLRMQRLRDEITTVSKLKRYLGGIMRDLELDEEF